MIPDYLDRFARLAMAHNAPARGLRLAAAAAAQRARFGLKSLAVDQARLASALQLAQQMLREDARVTVWAAGEGMTAEQAVAEAMADEAYDGEPG
jgi:hypothetical protein